MLLTIATERFTRLRLHRQIELDAAGPMELSFDFGNGAIGSFELRYITLESGQDAVYGKTGSSGTEPPWHFKSP